MNTGWSWKSWTLKKKEVGIFPGIASKIKKGMKKKRKNQEH